MDYALKWHRDYVAESVKRCEGDDLCAAWIDYAINCAEVVELAQQLGKDTGDEKLVSIAESVLATIRAATAGGSRRDRSYRTITDLQRGFLSRALRKQFGTPRSIANRVWQLTDAEIDTASA